MCAHRFVIYTSELETGSEDSPISGYEDVPLVSLEESVEPLICQVPNVSQHARKAKQNCKTLFDMSLDESASVYLYTTASAVFEKLNFSLRNKNHEMLKLWFQFLKLLIPALSKIPSERRTCWRAVQGHIGGTYSENDQLIWWSVSSCTSDLKVAEMYLGDNDKCTLFSIDCRNAKNIATYSNFKDEQELILMPGTRLKVKSRQCNYQDHLILIHLEEETFEKPTIAYPHELKCTVIPAMLDLLSKAVQIHRTLIYHLTNSLETYLILKNDLDDDLRITVDPVDNYDWDGVSRPDKVFQNGVLKAHQSWTERQEINARCTSANSTLRFSIDNKGEQFAIHINQWESLYPEEKHKEFNLDNGYVVKMNAWRSNDMKGYLSICFGGHQCAKSQDLELD